MYIFVQNLLDNTTTRTHLQHKNIWQPQIRLGFIWDRASYGESIVDIRLQVH
jgi:hypothetical protein